MSQHPEHELLQAFVDGTLGEHTAVHVALHLDDCPACSNVVRQLDDLSPAFAAVSDPVTPEALFRDILAASGHQPVIVPWVEVAVGTSLLLAAAATTLWIGGLASWWSRARTLVEILSTVSGDVLTQPAVVASLGVCALGLGLATVVLARTTTADRGDLA